jgi:hypothetical protein
MATFAVQADVERFLQIDVTAEPSAPVTMLLENATGIIQAYLHRDLLQTTYTSELYDPPDPQTGSLRLRQSPINEAVLVTGVVEDGAALVNGTDFLVYERQGRIVRTTAEGLPKSWVQKLQTVVVTYVAGYDFTTSPLVEPEALVARDTCTRIVARAWQAAAAYANAPIGGDFLKSLTLEGSDSVEYRDELMNVASAAVQLTEGDKMALAPLRRRILVGP